MPHKLDDDLLASKALKERLFDEAAFDGGYPTGYWVVRCRSNRKTVCSEKGYAASNPEALLAVNLCVELNEHIAHDGAWVVAWVGWGTKCISLWLDKDGDIQFTVEVEEDVKGMYDAGLDHWLNQCEEAWALWHQSMRVILDPSEDQTFQKARGQRPRSNGGYANDNVPDFEI